MTDPKYINATLANVMKETGGKVVEENLNYGKTSNDRIRSIFGSRAKGKTDEELNEIKKDPQKMGEMMYGSNTKMGRDMGNTEPGDGFKYRGRGNIGLTGKSNYAAASKAIYGDNRLVENPDLVNSPAVAAEITAWYMEKGQARMAKQLGVDTKNMTQAEANQLATSQVAGRAIKRGEGGYLEGETLAKVDKYSKDAKISGIAGAPVSEEARKAMAEGKPTPATGTTVADASKSRTEAAATDPRRTDRLSTATAATTTPASGEVQAPQFAMQSLIKDGIMPTTIAFQDLVKRGIMPMLTGTQVRSLEEGKTGKVKPEDSLAKGEEIISSIKSNMGKAINPETGELYTPVDLAKPKMRGAYDLAASETPKTEIIAQAEKAATEKAAMEKEQAENRAKLKQEEAMAMRGPSTQEGPLSGSSDLNTALAELIAISKRTAELNEKQLSVQSSLSGDLFA